MNGTAEALVDESDSQNYFLWPGLRVYVSLSVSAFVRGPRSL